MRHEIFEKAPCSFSKKRICWYQERMHRKKCKYEILIWYIVYKVVYKLKKHLVFKHTFTMLTMTWTHHSYWLIGIEKEAYKVKLVKGGFIFSGKGYSSKSSGWWKYRILWKTFPWTRATMEELWSGKGS